jgi:uncharacterized membrane protein
MTARSRLRRTALGTFLALSAIVGIAVPLPWLLLGIDRMAEADYGLAVHYRAQPGWIRLVLVVHAATSGLALTLVPVQFSARLRGRHPRWHRLGGRVSLAAIVAGSTTGIIVAQVSYAGVSGAIGFSCLAVLWLASTWRSAAFARARRFEMHRRWAIRSAALSFAGVTLRLWLPVLVALQRPVDSLAAEAAFDSAYQLVPFLSWVPNLLVAEWLIRRGQTH